MSALPSNPKPGVKATTLEWCEVQRWRGYRTSTFFAEDAVGGVIAESGAFRGDGDAARARHRELLDALEQLGWRATDEQDGEWFATRLSRVVELAPDTHLPPAAVEPAVHRVAPVVVAPPSPAPTAPVAAPAPVPAAPPPAPVLSTPRADRIEQRPGWQRALIALAALAAVAAAAGAVLVVAERLRPDVVVRTRTVTVTQSAPAPKPVSTPAPTSTATTPAASASPAEAPPPERVRLSVVGGERPSWVEIRRSSAKGRVLYAGDVEPGQKLTFSAPRIWTRFGAAGNLEIRANGRLVPLLGTIEHTFRS